MDSQIVYEVALPKNKDVDKQRFTPYNTDYELLRIYPMFIRRK